MLYKRNQLPELYTLKHRHDDDDTFMEYENVLFDKTLSPYIYENDMMLNYLRRLQVAVSILFDHMNLIKNFKNYMVDKYDYRGRG